MPIPKLVLSYSSPLSDRSATNPFAGDAPRPYDRQGTSRGTFCTNPYDSDLIGNQFCRYGWPPRPELAARQAGRLVLAELDRLAAARTDFAVETTFSGRTYLHLLRQWKAAGYRIEMVFWSLPSVQLAFQRIAARVRQGGHNILRADVVRRFNRSEKNFRSLYRPLADSWAVYDNSGDVPRLLEERP